MADRARRHRSAGTTPAKRSDRESRRGSRKRVTRWVNSRMNRSAVGSAGPAGSAPARPAQSAAERPQRDEQRQERKQAKPYTPPTPVPGRRCLPGTTPQPSARTSCARGVLVTKTDYRCHEALIIEDEVPSLERARGISRSARLRYRQCPQRRGGARERLGDQSCELVLCDLMLPDGSGRPPGRRRGALGDGPDDGSCQRRHRRPGAAPASSTI